MHILIPFTGIYLAIRFLRPIKVGGTASKAILQQKNISSEFAPNCSISSDSKNLTNGQFSEIIFRRDFDAIELIIS